METIETVELTPQPNVAEHVCTQETCPDGGKYFVSAVDADRVFFMAGPYRTHQEALDKVQTALMIADKHDGRAWFMSWGTCRLEDDSTRIGTLNKHNLI